MFAVGSLLAAIAAVVRAEDLSSREVYVLERFTLGERARAARATTESARLALAPLRAQQQVDVELCAADGMPATSWLGAMSLAVWRPGARELLVRTELDARTLAFVRRGGREACLTIGSGRIQHDDEYAVEALWSRAPVALYAVPMTLSVQARPVLGVPDRAIVLLGWLMALGLALTIALSGMPSAAAAPELEDADEEARAALRGSARGHGMPAWARLSLAIVVLGGVFVATGWLPGGASIAVVGGLGLALTQVALALALAPVSGRFGRASALALERPHAAWRWLAAAFLGGVLLRYAALAATRFVPSTGQSAVQLFVSWPSGLFSFACLAVLVPAAEEIFFRGFVYGVLERRSRALAFGGAATFFALAHLPQTWGQWGALAALVVTSLALTALRAASRSTAVAAVAHLVYNALLALSAVGLGDA
jgi:membrane protease YdiL (CAAX protease family)